MSSANPDREAMRERINRNNRAQDFAHGKAVEFYSRQGICSFAAEFAESEIAHDRQQRNEALRERIKGMRMETLLPEKDFETTNLAHDAANYIVDRCLALLDEEEKGEEDAK